VKQAPIIKVGPSKRTLHRLLQRRLTPEQVSFKLIPHRQAEPLRLSIIRRCEAILKSWQGVG